MSTVYPGYRSTPTTSNITLSSGGAGASTITVTGAGGGGGTGSVLMSAGSATSWTNTKTTGQLHLEGKNADLIMNGVSLKGILDGITDRLSILQPKPELLTKYENLREAYEHYKTLEALLHQEEDNAK
jgi:hypothetical protein